MWMPHAELEWRKLKDEGLQARFERFDSNKIYGTNMVRKLVKREQALKEMLVVLKRLEKEANMKDLSVETSKSIMKQVLGAIERGYEFHDDPQNAKKYTKDEDVAYKTKVTPFLIKVCEAKHVRDDDDPYMIKFGSATTKHRTNVSFWTETMKKFLAEIGGKTKVEKALQTVTVQLEEEEDKKAVKRARVEWKSIRERVDLKFTGKKQKKLETYRLEKIEAEIKDEQHLKGAKKLNKTHLSNDKKDSENAKNKHKIARDNFEKKFEKKELRDLVLTEQRLDLFLQDNKLFKGGLKKLEVRLGAYRSDLIAGLSANDAKAARAAVQRIEHYFRDVFKANIDKVYEDSSKCKGKDAANDLYTEWNKRSVDNVSFGDVPVPKKVGKEEPPTDIDVYMKRLEWYAAFEKDHLRPFFGKQRKLADTERRKIDKKLRGSYKDIYKQAMAGADEVVKREVDNEMLIESFHMKHDWQGYTDTKEKPTEKKKENILLLVRQRAAMEECVDHVFKGKMASAVSNKKRFDDAMKARATALSFLVDVKAMIKTKNLMTIKDFKSAHVTKLKKQLKLDSGASGITAHTRMLGDLEDKIIGGVSKPSEKVSKKILQQIVDRLGTFVKELDERVVGFGDEFLESFRESTAKIWTARLSGGKMWQVIKDNDALSEHEQFFKKYDALKEKNKTVENPTEIYRTLFNEQVPKFVQDQQAATEKLLRSVNLHLNNGCDRDVYVRVFKSESKRLSRERMDAAKAFWSQQDEPEEMLDKLTEYEIVKMAECEQRLLETCAMYEREKQKLKAIGSDLKRWDVLAANVETLKNKIKKAESKDDLITKINAWKAEHSCGLTCEHIMEDEIEAKLPSVTVKKWPPKSNDQEALEQKIDAIVDRIVKKEFFEITDVYLENLRELANLSWKIYGSSIWKKVLIKESSVIDTNSNEKDDAKKWQLQRYEKAWKASTLFWARDCFSKTTDWASRVQGMKALIVTKKKEPEHSFAQFLEEQIKEVKSMCKKLVTIMTRKELYKDQIVVDGARAKIMHNRSATAVEEWMKIQITNTLEEEKRREAAIKVRSKKASDPKPKKPKNIDGKASKAKETKTKKK